jgi:hypothetical protein
MPRLVGTQQFCVPQESLIETSGWLADATRHARSDGFAFALGRELLAPKLNYQPAPDIQGQPMSISGTLSADRSDEWLARLPPDHYWRRLAEAPEAIVELDARLHQIRAYQTAERDRWVVWAIEPSLELRPSSIAGGGTIAAVCHRTDFRAITSRKVDDTTTCARRTRQGGYFLSYTFAEANLSRLQELDSEVWRIVLSWQCKTRGAR